MIGIISMLGGQFIQDDIAKTIKKQNCSFLTKDCGNEITLLSEVEKFAQTVDVIIIHQLMLKNLEGVLPEIRKLTERARIILILSGARNQYTKVQLSAYQEYCLEEDFIYEEKRIDTFDLLKAIMRGSLDKRQEDEAEVFIEPEPEPVREEPTPERRKRAEKPPRPPKSPKEPKPPKPPRQRKPPRPAYDAREEGRCYTIAVFGATCGAGVTNMVYTLAEFLSLNGRRVLAVNLTDGDEFRHIKGKADYKNDTDIDIFEAEQYYDLIIYDAGMPFIINSDGVFCGLHGDYPGQIIETVKYCSIKIVMALSDPWHIKKCEYFLTDENWTKIISNDYIFLLDKGPDSRLRSRYPDINMYNRNNESFADEIARLFL